MALILKQIKTVVATAGIPKRLSDVSIKTPAAVVTALETNTGAVHIGDSSIDSSTELGTPLESQESLELKAVDYEGTSEEVELSDIYIDADNNGEGVIVSYYERQSDVAPDTIRNEKSLSFDGVDEYVDGGNNSSGVIITTGSVSFWVKINTLPGVAGLMTRWGEGATADRYNSIRVEGTGIIRVIATNTGGSADIDYEGSVDINDGLWHQIVITFDFTSSNDIRFYVDGIEDTSLTKNIDNPISGLNPSSEPLFFGAQKLGGSGLPGLFLDGNLDEPALWGIALSAAQVTEIYNSGTPTNLTQSTGASGLVSWWRFGDGNLDTGSFMEDKVGVNDGTTVNMDDSNIVSDVP